MPGAGKSTLLAGLPRRPGLVVLDSDEHRAALARRFPRLPYRRYRWLVHLRHRLAAVRAAWSGAPTVVVHLPATSTALRTAVALLAALTGRTAHLLWLHVDPDEALRGQRERGRLVPSGSFAGHARRAAAATAALRAGRAAGWQTVVVAGDRPPGRDWCWTPAVSLPVSTARAAGHRLGHCRSRQARHFGAYPARAAGHRLTATASRLGGVFDTLSDRLSGALRDLRGKGRLSDADIDATAREIRIALLEADVALPVVRAFVNRIKERAKGAEVSGALNPAQQVVKIVNDELVNILGGETRRLRLAKEPPTVIMLAGLQGSGKTTLAGKLARWLKGQGHTPLLVACDLQRPNAVTQLQIVGERAGVPTFAPHPGASGPAIRQRRHGAGDPVDVARRGVAHAVEKHYDIVIVDTAGRLGVDAELMRQAVGHPRRRAAGRDPVRRRRDDRPGRRGHGRGVPRRCRLHRCGAHQAGRRRPRWRRAVRAAGHRRADHVRQQRGEAGGLRRLPPRPDGQPHPRHGRPAHADRAGRAALRRRADGEDRGQDRHGRADAGGLPRADARHPQDGPDRQHPGHAARREPDEGRSSRRSTTASSTSCRRSSAA